MGDSQKSYYQVSFTGTQALLALLVVLGALGLSFFLGARAGFSRAERKPDSGEAAHGTVSPAPAAEPPASSVTAGPSPSPAPGKASASAAAPASAGPIVTQTFEDREAGIPEETAPRSTELKPSGARPSRTEIVGSPAPSREEPKPEAKSAQKPAGFYVQVLSTSSKAEASRWKERLAGKKYKASVSSVESKKGKLFRVRVGPYADKEQAKKVAAKISSEDKRQAWVAPAE
jgi:cell division septation protein DedD